MVNPWIKTSGLCRYYQRGRNEVRAVDRVDLAIDRGEFAALVGASGSTTGRRTFPGASSNEWQFPEPWSKSRRFCLPTSRRGISTRTIRPPLFRCSATSTAALGILTGWAGTRIVAAVARVIMKRQEMPIFDPFALPFWLVLLSMAFGVLVSLLAGAYPSRRVDPVEALRSD